MLASDRLHIVYYCFRNASGVRSPILVGMVPATFDRNLTIQAYGSTPCALHVPKTV